MASVKSLFTQSLFYGLSTVVPRLLNYFLVPLYTRVFLPQEYGIITEMYAYLGFFLVLLTFGLETGFFKFASKYESIDKVYPTSFYFLLTSSIIAVTLFSFFSSAISTSLGINYHPYYIVILGLVISIDALSAITFAKLRYLNKALLFSSLKIIGVTVNIVLNVLFLVVLPKVSGFLVLKEIDLIGAVFISNLISSLLVFFISLIITKIPKIQFNKLIFKELMIYSLPLLLAGLGGTTNETFDRIFIKYLIPQEDNPLYQLGIYGSNVKLAVLLVLFIQMYRFAAEPFFFQNQEENKKSNLFSKTITAFTVFCLIVFLGVSLNLPILKFMVGREFREQLSIVPLLLIANILFGTFFNFSFWYKLSGKTLYGIKYTFIGATITIIANFALIPIIGIYGSAISRIICYSFMNLLSYRDGKKAGFINWEKNNLFLYVLISVLIFIIGFSVYFYNETISLILGNMLIIAFLFFIFKKEKLSLNFIFSRSK
jgi:O-antigen/teichoic acid export membrane protein